MARMREEEPAKKKKKMTTRSERAPWPSSESDDNEPILQTVYKPPSLLTPHRPSIPLHSCSGSGNSFVDITSNQAQPLSNFLLIQPDQWHLQILIEVKVQLEDYRPPPLPNPLNRRTKEGGHSCISRGTDPVQCGPGWPNSTLPGCWSCARHAPQQTTSQYGPLQRQEGVQHPSEHRINMFVVSGYLHRNVLFVVSTRWFFYWFRPKSSKCWRRQNPF